MTCSTLGRPEIGELAEGDRRRLLDDAAQGQPRAVRPDPPGRADRAPARPPPSTSPRQPVDERADGAWHAEWATLRTLLRRTVVAGSQADRLLAGLRVDADRMAATLDAARDDVLAEQRSMAALGDTDATPADDVPRRRRPCSSTPRSTAPAPHLEETP